MADLTVTLTESITVNGHQYGGTKTYTVSSIVDVYKRILTVPTGVDTTLVSFKATVGSADSAMDIQNVKYIRITNLDGTNSVNLSLQIDTDEDDSAADDSATVLLEAGKSFMLHQPHDGITAAGGVASALKDLESIIVESSSSAVSIEIFIGLT